MERRHYSVRRHLLRLIALPILLAGLLIGAFAFASVWHEIEEVYDAQLSHSAKVLLRLTDYELAGRGGTDIPLQSDQPLFAHKYEKNISFRIWKDETLIGKSTNADGFDGISAPPGFSDQMVNGEPWRFFVYMDDRSGTVIEVAERYEIRAELILQILGSLLVPMLVFLPVILVVIWVGIARSLKPLTDLSEAVDSRDTGDLRPITAQRIPEEIMPLVTALNRLFARVSESFSREREFTDNAAHELRTPLAAMKTQTQVLIKRAGKSPDLREGLDNLQSSIDRATHMVEQLLSFARLQSRDMEMADMDFSLVVKQTLQDISPLALAKNQEFEADIAAGVTVRGNADALAILVRNLLDNAIKYTPEGGGISVELVRREGVVCLTVSDTGPGIPDADKERVLERFTRGVALGGSGSGLGLAMAKWVVDSHQAKLILSDNSPRGLNARVQL